MGMGSGAATSTDSSLFVFALTNLFSRGSGRRQESAPLLLPAVVSNARRTGGLQAEPTPAECPASLADGDSAPHSSCITPTLTQTLCGWVGVCVCVCVVLCPQP